MTTDNEVIRTLCRRIDYLQCLEEGERTRREIANEQELSESTVYKHLRELETRGFVTTTTTGYRLTLFGQVLVQYYQKLQSLSEFKDLLSILPPTVRIEPAVLENAEVLLAEPHAPHEPVDYVVETAATSTRLCGFSPTFLRAYWDLFEQSLDVGTDTMYLFEEDVIGHLSSYHPDKLDRMSTSSTLSLRVLDDSLPFGLFVCDDELVFIVFHDANGEVVGVGYNGTDRAIDWGKHTFRTYWDHAREIEDSRRAEPPNSNDVKRDNRCDEPSRTYQIMRRSGD